MSERIEREVLLPVPVEEAWEAVTEPAELEEWLADEVQIDLEEGGAARFRWDDGSERSGTVELVAEPVRLVFRWEDPETGASFVELTLIPVDDGTRLRVVETQTMPFANKTGMTDQERGLLARWIAAGAPLR